MVLTNKLKGKNSKFAFDKPYQDLLKTTADNAVLDVFTVTGQKALTRTLAPGTTDVSLAPGVYIIKVADQAVRVVVR